MFRPEKNQGELVEIASGFPAEIDWQMWLAGDGPELPACAALARRRGLDGRVKFLGFERDVTGLYAAADVAVHASGTESLSNFIIEAQAHGLPAVVHQAQGIRECLVPESTGWVIPRGDRTAFRAAVLGLIREGPEARAARGRQAQAFARAAFDPARQVTAY
jgi:glycosyltransferase involved in cell wall biosynthesis